MLILLSVFKLHISVVLTTLEEGPTCQAPFFPNTGIGSRLWQEKLSISLTESVVNFYEGAVFLLINKTYINKCFQSCRGDGPSALSVIPLARDLLSLHCDPHCMELQELQSMEACLCSTMGSSVNPLLQKHNIKTLT